MVKDLRLQLLDAAGGDGTVLDDAVRFLDQALQLPHFLFVLLVLHHCLLERVFLFFFLGQYSLPLFQIQFLVNIMYHNNKMQGPIYCCLGHFLNL